MKRPGLVDQLAQLRALLRPRLPAVTDQIRLPAAAVDVEAAVLMVTPVEGPGKLLAAFLTVWGGRVAVVVIGRP